jgi:hypothetical protein
MQHSPWLHEQVCFLCRLVGVQMEGGTLIIPGYLTLETILLGALPAGMILLAMELRRRGPARPPQEYDPQRAWLRAGIYFCACWLFGLLTGVAQTLFTRPLVLAQQLANPAWLLFTGLCFVVVGVGYWVIWPRGTQTHGRRLNLPAVLLFGALWGFSEPVLFLSFWTLVGRVSTVPVLRIAGSFIAVAAFIGLWHSLYWDIYVAPPHNIQAWNLRKVLFVHVPNLLVSLSYLAVYDNSGVFVLVQAFGLLGSTLFMRFPGFWSPNASLFA